MADPAESAPRHEEIERSAPMHAQADAAGQPHAENGLVLDELLVEDVSIDGMCGVY